MTDTTEKRKEQLRNAAKTYRAKNIERSRNKERLYKLNFREFERLRKIELF